ncbi:PfkB family carbohydrate kinase [uncultured Desulfuromonas sp.]|uniref:PfkB family carbohydrate kinase n=1 Tax=uncultured Desulfuromonas sp. TaxID=181013 RepID=UPI002621D047|nr:PfkB family carbohydrate kinase [uncultured Desulfuromonas sp.]
MSHQVVGLGQCALDLLGTLSRYPGVDEKAELHEVLIQGGGPVATALVALCRLGVETAFWGRVGDDDFGEKIRSGLEGEGVDCSGLLSDSGRTSQVAFIAVEGGSAHRNIFWHRGSARPLEPDEVDPGILGAAQVLHLDGLQRGASLAAARIARSRGLITVLDGGTFREGTEELLPLIDHPVVSERFARSLCPDDPLRAVDLLLDRGGLAATVTLGALGSHTGSREGERFHQPAFLVDAVDTTGCGDVFHGGYIFGLLQGWPLKRVVRFAAACAALKARKLGGRTAIPTLAEAEAFLAERVDA